MTTRPFALNLDARTLDALEAAAARVGQSPAAFLADQLAVAFGIAAAHDTGDRPRPTSRSARRRRGQRRYLETFNTSTP